MNDINMNQLLVQMRSMAGRIEGLPVQSTQPTTGGSNFSDLMTRAIDSVNETQQVAASKASAFETGSEELDLAEVMISLQKASVSFQAITQVRNKLVSAYQEIMNMPV